MIALAVAVLALLALGVLTHRAPSMRKGRVGYPRDPFTGVKPNRRLFAGELLTQRLQRLVRGQRTRRLA